MKKELVLLGGGHAHMMVLENISTFTAKGFGVTVIGPSDFHYYSGMGPGMLGGTYSPDDIRFATKDVVEKQGGRFIRDKVDRIDPEKKSIITQTQGEVSYDVASFNTGSYIPMAILEGSDDNIYPVKPIEKLWEASQKLETLFKRQKCRVSIVGGGPSSAEIAGNVWQLAKKSGSAMPEITIFARHQLMCGFNQRVRSRVLATLKKRGIRILENARVAQVQPGRIILESSTTHGTDSFDTDFTFMAPGVRPSAIFEASGLSLGPDKGLLVNEYLQSVDHPDIFGGGDCIYFQPHPLDKVGVYAVRQNPVLLHNLMAALENTELKQFNPGPDYLLIFNLGGNNGVLKKNGIVFGGRLAFMIKDYIDTKFMKEFQAIEARL